MTNRPLTDRVVAALASAGWSAELQDTGTADEDHLLLAPLDDVDDDGQLVVVVVHEQRRLVNLYGLVPFDVPEERLVDAAVYLTMANFGLLQGCFELDMADGEVRFRISLSAGDEADDRLAATLAAHLALSGAALAVYGSGLVDVVNGDSAPADAIAAVEPA
jgi:hypothetical protein